MMGLIVNDIYFMASLLIELSTIFSNGGLDVIN